MPLQSEHALSIDAPDDPGTRQCGRCRFAFAVVGAEATAIADWWLCADCRPKLIGGRR